MDNLEKPIQTIKGVGPKTSMMLNRLNIFNIEDLMTHFPRAYEDRSNIKPINKLSDGEVASIIGEISLIDRDKYTTGGKHITRIIIKNETGYAAGIWYNQKFIKKNFKIGDRFLFYGKISKLFSETQIVNPEFEKINKVVHGAILPVYPLTKNLSQNMIRNILKKLIDSEEFKLTETIPQYLRLRYGLCDMNYAIRNIHFPENSSNIYKAEKRLKFEELLILQLGLMIERTKLDMSSTGISFDIKDEMKRFVFSLPFNLTSAQKKTVNDVLKDMKSVRPMNRLVQGDVGSGKTIIAVIALFNAVKNGYQGVMMAPTEILASQHYETLKRLFNDYGINVELLSARIPKKEKEKIKEKIKSGIAHVVIGTHAVIQDDVEFRNLGLVVTDEQHRFGVRQRALISQKGQNPDVLVMTATPIPRTMALFIYGDLDISVIDELPPGRQKIETYVVRPSIRQRAYNFVRDEVAKGRQAYVVCPLIDESDTIDIESAIETAEKLRNKYLNGINIGLLHGKMKSEEKDQIMTDFKNGIISVLVSTTVIEVGINVPNATIMVIENADRFGLAELHQLRGRVGRGEHKSYCILISDMRTDISRQRMKIIKDTSNGFEIAERDLKLRGTGEFFGTRQHGLPELKLADIFKDAEILRTTNKLARELILSGNMDSDDFRNLKVKVEKKFKQKIEHITFN